MSADSTVTDSTVTDLASRPTVRTWPMALLALSGLILLFVAAATVPPADADLSGTASAGVQR